MFYFARLGLNYWLNILRVGRLSRGIEARRERYVPIGARIGIQVIAAGEPRYSAAGSSRRACKGLPKNVMLRLVPLGTELLKRVLYRTKLARHATLNPNGTSRAAHPGGACSKLPSQIFTIRRDDEERLSSASSSTDKMGI